MSDPTAKKPIVYTPLGICMYCKKSAEQVGHELQDEHIVTYALNGGWILPQSSCKRCAKLTSRYEQTCARHIFGNFRIHYGYQTRSPEDRPPTIEIGVNTPDGNKASVDVLRSEFPAPFLFYKFARAGILEGKLKSQCRFEPIPIVIGDGKAVEEYKLSHPEWDGVFKWRASQLELARLLAKVAHGHAVAILGLGKFEPMLLNIILGNTNKVAYLVGGEEEIPPSAAPTKEHFLGITFQISEARKSALIVVHIRLFGQCGTPTFHAVAGEFQFSNPIHAAAFAEFIKDGELVSLGERPFQ